MTRRRVNAIPLVVDVDGVEIHASLRRQRGKTGNWNVRWPRFGRNEERSTGVNSLEEAKRVARRLIRGESIPSAMGSSGMTVKEFEKIQDGHFRLKARSEAGEKSATAFHGVWRSFLRAYPIKTIQEVTDVMASGYLNTMLVATKSRNRTYKAKVKRPMSVETVRKHIRTLASAWNRVRKSHRAKKGGIPDGKLVDRNPWEEIRNNIPEPKKKGDPVQFNLDAGELVTFLDQFSTRPIAELFLIMSLWCAGRIQEMSRIEWRWLNGDYVDIPDEVAKRGKGKVVRIPRRIRERLDQHRVDGSPYVFAGFADEVERNLQSCHEVLPFTPERMVERLEKYIGKAAEAIGRPEITHHALRRTAMELSDEGELREKEKSSAEKLQTTVGNKRRNYIKRKGKKAIAKADGLYENLTVSLQDYPALADRLGCEPVEVRQEAEVEALVRRLSPIERRRLQKRLSEDAGEGGGQGVA
jgi:integrase